MQGNKHQDNVEVLDRGTARQYGARHLMNWEIENHMQISTTICSVQLLLSQCRSTGGGHQHRG